MAKFLSRYLNKEFEVASYEGQENGEPIQILSHEALENIVHNMAPKELKLRYDFKDMLISDNHCVICCTFQDAEGRRIQAIGETLPATLETDIARNYPAVMAAQRAFDRCAIRYFDFPGKVMSNLEGVDSDAVNNGETNIDVSSPLPAEENPANAPVAPPAPAPAASIVGEPNRQPTNKAPVRGSQSVQGGGVKNENAAKTTATTDPGSVIFDATQKYRGLNMTIAQVYESKPSYIDWFVNTYHATSAHAIEIQKTCAAFLKQIGGQK